MQNLIVNFLTVFILTTQPLSVHYSSHGDYLVDQNGEKVVIKGHPHMTCYAPEGEVRGVLQKVRGSTIWLISGKRYVELKHPVCDLK